MAQRLEAALRRPPVVEDARPETEKPQPAEVEIEAEPPGSQPHRPVTSEIAKPARPEARTARNESRSAAGSSLYDSLEQEMASLLGRPGKD
jgi:hypothetical protein